MKTNSRSIFAVAAMAWTLLPPSGLGQLAVSSSLDSSAGAQTKSPLDEVKDARFQADVLNKAVATLNNSGLVPDWLKALNVQFKTFEATSSDKNATLGVEYSYDKAVTDAKVVDSENPAYLTFSLKARGNVALDKENNPADFLQSGAQFHLWQFFGQTQEDPLDKNGQPLSDRVFKELASDKYKGMTGPELRATPEWRGFVEHAFDNDPMDFLYDLAGNLSLESNQSFSKKQMAYGLEMHATLRVWDPNSPLSKFNVLDWPFAATRMLGGESFRPRGRFLPSAMIGIDLIDPTSDTDRFKIDSNKSAYPRFKAEIGFRSEVVEIDNKPIWFNASYRFFQEIGASTAIQNAGMDTQHYFAASLDLLWNVSVTYSVGKLPFDLKDQQVWALGYNIKF